MGRNGVIKICRKSRDDINEGDLPRKGLGVGGSEISSDIKIVT